MSPRTSLYAALPLALGCASPQAIEDVSYDDRFGEETTLDVYLPDDGATARPAVMFLHGGDWASSDKSAYTSAAERLGGSGYVTASVNYRLAPDAIYPAAIQDARCALAFLRANAAEYGLDPARIAVVGYSSGGHLASMLGVANAVPELEPDCAAGTTGPAAAVVAASAHHDLVLMADAPEVEQFLGGTIDEVPDRFRLASPITHVRPGAPPYLLVHGGIDFNVAKEQSERMREALLAQENEVHSLELFDAGHFLATGADNGGLYYGTVSSRPETWTTLIDFLYETLGTP